MRQNRKKLKFSLYFCGVMTFFTLFLFVNTVNFADLTNEDPRFPNFKVDPADASIEFTLDSPSNMSQIQPGTDIRISFSNSSPIEGMWYQWNEGNLEIWDGSAISTTNLPD